MRIQEMRSGRAYLSKRVPRGRIQTFESRNSHRDFPATAEEIDAFIEAELRPVERQDVPLAPSDLEKPQWSVVSFDGVIAGGLTYSQAARLVDILGVNQLKGLCVITDVAALSVKDAH